MQTQALFEAFNGKRVLVIGDVMTDAYLHGQVLRMSPEAPVPVVDLQTQDQRIGGAGNVALNLIALGAEALLASVIGQDSAGQELQTMFDTAGINTAALVTSAERKTTIKTRVLSAGKQMLRIDNEDQHDLSAAETAALQNGITGLLSQGVDGILLEDYNKGVLTTELIEWIIAEAKALQIPVVVDPKKKNFFAYKGCTLFKPNLKELKEGLQITFDYHKEPNSLNLAIEKLQHHLESRFTFVTLSEHGVQLFDGQNHFHHPAHLRNIADVSGAGDTVIATTCLCLICGAEPSTIAAIANLAGGLVCEQPGVVRINKQKLLEEALQLNA
ncbi:MAG: bifunctional ADP-heptose synthase [Crocinitomicaceae bacterium]|jgi:D-glycero-beta-D-manno-heptose-7-phosphate kinase|nr:bifunctional ADP-heptose synthase [Crocinitomicaceae bacterium]MDP4738911.1 bifunctional ADP-heptose synthase [Crocinitomicaceae bacterium]MDP4798981.1 bifunctional ADP-heptose synthase [Crocinitomicaceae bacterium]MDP4868827.1 bifunctional ADP-heptose synthase [Crocinitomicaceae bacterium]MDP4955668.1 bifunctional ADP-heptose synthase [Crocinitomicaceae bacterium]